MRYPIYFLNNEGIEVARISKEISIDGTPRYTINPKCQENTYMLQDCIKDWHPVYKYFNGDKVYWNSRLTGKNFDCIIVKVKRKDNLIRIVPDIKGTNPMPYQYFYVEPFELKLK